MSSQKQSLSARQRAKKRYSNLTLEQKKERLRKHKLRKTVWFANLSPERQAEEKQKSRSRVQALKGAKTQPIPESKTQPIGRRSVFDEIDLEDSFLKMIADEK